MTLMTAVATVRLELLVLFWLSRCLCLLSWCVCLNTCGLPSRFATMIAEYEAALKKKAGSGLSPDGRE